jgi:putative ABC transport system permease protein
LFVHLLESIKEDIRFAFRMMRHNRGLTAVSVLSLALGIGATIAIFSVIYALALRPLPVERPEELVELDRGSGLGLNGHSYAE